MKWGTYKSNGFTLIELMIVVAIIGIIASIAIPQYQTYVIRTQLSRAYYELSPLRTAIESFLSHGDTSFTKADIGYSSSNITNLSASLTLNWNTDGSGRMSVTLGNEAHTTIHGAIINLNRDAFGVWQCVIDSSGATHWQANYNPENCS